MGFGYIKSSEYEAWAKLNRVKISTAELQVLKSLDRAHVSIRNPSDEPPPPQEPVSFIEQLTKLAPEKVRKKAK